MSSFFGQPRFRLWLLVLGSSTLLIGTSYAMVQQSTRLSANDAPMALSRQIKANLETGESPDGALSDIFYYYNGKKPDLSKSDEGLVFAIIKEKPRSYVPKPYTTSTVTLDGQIPLPPEGVLTYTDNHGSDSVTWQPRENIRIAMTAVTYSYGDVRGYVITGQSLKSFEERITTYGQIALVAWIAALVWVSAVLYWPSRFRPKAKK